MEEFDSINFVSRFGGNQLMLRVLSHTGSANQSDDIFEDQCNLIYDAAVNAAHGKWDFKSFIAFYPEVKDYFLDLMHEEINKIEWRKRVARLRNPGALGKITVYCARGCNQIQVDAEEPWDECAACGQLMTPNYEDSYYEGLVRSGQVQ